MHIMGGSVESGEGVVKVVADNNLAFEQIEIIINHFSIQGSPKIHLPIRSQCTLFLHPEKIRKQ